MHIILTTRLDVFKHFLQEQNDGFTLILSALEATQYNTIEVAQVAADRYIQNYLKEFRYARADTLNFICKFIEVPVDMYNVSKETSAAVRRAKAALDDCKYMYNQTKYALMFETWYQHPRADIFAIEDYIFSYGTEIEKG